ncbi:MAG TPA: DedA family protein [Gemmatimonadales bacterium]
MHQLQQLIHWLLDTLEGLGYPGIVLLMAIESSIVPLPSELVMPPAGYLAQQGKLSVWLVILAGTVGSVLGALANYALAQGLGRPVLHRYGKYFLVREQALNKAEAFFLRHGEVSTFVGRLLPVVRHLISIPAGLARMSVARFAMYTALGAGLWCTVLTSIGWYVATKAEAMTPQLLADYTAQATRYALPVIVLVVLIHVWRSRRSAGQAPSGQS